MKKTKIKVIGDIMLDVWCFGKYEKKSAEAPINIFEPNAIKYSLGGVGNLSNNLKSLRVDHQLLTEIGYDNNGLKIQEILKEQKIKTFFFKSKKTSTLKERFFYKNKQIFRRDSENTSINKNFINNIQKNIRNNDTVIVSDYKKGLISESLIKFLIKKNCKIFVDPKNKPEIFKNAFLVKPNMEKFEEWCGKFTEKKAFDLLKKMNWHWLVISINKSGVFVVNKKGEKNYYKVEQIKEPNVIGAGDILFSGIIYNYLKKMDIFTSVELSAYATTKCVAKKKIRKIKVNDFKKDIIFTNGVFDIIHKGHIDLLKFSKKIGKKLILAINSDKSVRLNKGNYRPYNPLKKRIYNLKKLKLIDQIIFFNEKTPIKLIKKIKPDVIVKGNDYSFKNVIGHKYANIILFKKKNQLSSTKLISKLNRLN